MNILISAYAVSPFNGSEPGVGWNWIIQISKFATVHVITEIEFKAKIDSQIEKLGLKNKIFFYYVNIGPSARKMCWNQGDWRFYFFYRRWQIKAYHQALDIVARYPIDVVHQLNMIGFREPGFLWKLSDIPFVWGPVGGLNIVNLKYLDSYGHKIKFFYFFKNFLNYIQLIFSYRVRRAAYSSKLLLVANKEMQAGFKKFYKINSIVLNETGADRDIVYKDQVQLVNNSFDIVWVGRFIPTKLLYLALNVISKLIDLENLKLHIVGSGNSDEELFKAKNFAKSCGVENLCVWHGTVSHQEVQLIMQNSKLLLFTSIVEGTSHVVIEAINNKLPVFCFNICGHGEIVSSDIGCKIDLTYPEDSINKFASLIRYYYYNPDKLNTMSLNCVKVASDISWQSKGFMIKKFYNMLK